MILDQILVTLLPYMILICLSGVTLGILWGAMPGLSTTMAMVLLIGLSAGMEQNVAIMFMLGVYTGSVFGGAISAISYNKEQKIRKCAKFYLQQNDLNEYNTPCRFDVIALEGDINQPQITWLRNAF